MTKESADSRRIDFDFDEKDSRKLLTYFQFIDLDRGIQGLTHLVGSIMENVNNLAKANTLQNKILSSRLTNIENVQLYQESHIMRKIEELQTSIAAVMKCTLEMRQIMGQVTKMQVNSLLMFTENHGAKLSEKAILDRIFKGEDSLTAATAKEAFQDARSGTMMNEDDLLTEVVARLYELNFKEIQNPKKSPSMVPPDETPKENYAEAVRRLKKRGTEALTVDGKQVFFEKGEVLQIVDGQRRDRFPNTTDATKPINIFSTDEEVAEAYREAEALAIKQQKRYQHDRIKEPPPDDIINFDADSEISEFSFNPLVRKSSVTGAAVEESPSRKRKPEDENEPAKINDTEGETSDSAEFETTIEPVLAPSEPTPTSPQPGPAPKTKHTASLRGVEIPSVLSKKKKQKLDSKKTTTKKTKQPTARKSTTPRKKQIEPSELDDSVVELSPDGLTPKTFVFDPEHKIARPDGTHPLYPHVQKNLDQEGLKIKEEIVQLNEKSEEVKQEGTPQRSRKQSKPKKVFSNVEY